MAKRSTGNGGHVAGRLLRLTGKQKQSKKNLSQNTLQKRNQRAPLKVAAYLRDIALLLAEMGALPKLSLIATDVLALVLFTRELMRAGFSLDHRMALVPLSFMPSVGAT